MVPGGHETHDNLRVTLHMRSLFWNPFPFMAHTMQKLMVCEAACLAEQLLLMEVKASAWFHLTTSGNRWMLKLSCSALHEESSALHRGTSSQPASAATSSPSHFDIAMSPSD